MPGAVPADQRHARDRHGEAEDLRPGDPLAEQQCADSDRERRRRLQHERSETGRHPGVHCAEQEAELQDTEARAVEHEPAHRDLWARHEDDYRDRDDEKSKCCEEEGRELIEPGSDGQEVQPPEQHYEQGEVAVTSGHASNSGRRPTMSTIEYLWTIYVVSRDDRRSATACAARIGRPGQGRSDSEGPGYDAVGGVAATQGARS